MLSLLIVFIMVVRIYGLQPYMWTWCDREWTVKQPHSQPWLLTAIQRQLQMTYSHLFTTSYHKTHTPILWFTKLALPLPLPEGKNAFLKYFWIAFLIYTLYVNIYHILFIHFSSSGFTMIMSKHHMQHLKPMYQKMPSLVAYIALPYYYLPLLPRSSLICCRSFLDRCTMHASIKW